MFHKDLPYLNKLIANKESDESGGILCGNFTNKASWFGYFTDGKAKNKTELGNINKKIREKNDFIKALFQKFLSLTMEV